ncbi:hypothetical protein MPLA_680011 [Mesorhizobium sp. ORS 3359]|nr:hypothetical protein MPLA_680011 [Mesorhizobium sp. ORS 3359]
MIGHIKAEHRMDRNYLAGEQGDAVNAILAAAGYNSSLLPNWFGQHLWLLLAALGIHQIRQLRNGSRTGLVEREDRPAVQRVPPSHLEVMISTASCRALRPSACRQLSPIETVLSRQGGLSCSEQVREIRWIPLAISIGPTSQISPAQTMQARNSSRLTRRVFRSI